MRGTGNVLQSLCDTFSASKLTALFTSSGLSLVPKISRVVSIDASSAQWLVSKTWTLTTPHNKKSKGFKSVF